MDADNNNRNMQSIMGDNDPLNLSDLFMDDDSPGVPTPIVSPSEIS